jgi:ADP-ribose pyrophosphatase
MTATVNHSRLLHSGRVFDFFKDSITLQNGTSLDLEIIRHPGAAAIVPLTDQKEVILLRQYRYAVGGFIWEIPAGTLSGEESPLVCAQRELTEETGYSAGTWEKLGEITPVPGYSDERIHLFMAGTLSQQGQNLDSDEVLDVHTIPFDQALDMALTGMIQDAKTITALFLAARRSGRLSPAGQKAD